MEKERIIRNYLVWSDYGDCSMWLVKADTAKHAKELVCRENKYPLTMLKVRDIERIFNGQYKRVIKLCENGEDNSSVFMDDKPIPIGWEGW